MNKNSRMEARTREELKDRVRHIAVKAFCDCPFIWSQFEEVGLKQGMSGAELAVGSVLLRRTGELDTYRLSDGHVEYRLTPSALHRSYACFWGAGAVPPQSKWGETRKGGALPMFRLLAYIGANRIPLTRAGEAPARLLVKLSSLLRLSPPLTVFYLHAAIRLRLVEGKQELDLNVAHLSSWLQLSSSWIEAILYRLWVEKGVPLEPKLRHFCYVGNRFNEMVIPADDPLSILKAYFDVSDIGLEDFRGKVMQPLCSLGWASSEEMLNGNEMYRLMLPDPFLVFIEETPRINGKSEASSMNWYIQPDFEVWIVGETNYALLWELQLMCEERYHDSYALTPMSWRKALSSGRTGEACLQFLDEHSLGGIPDNVSAALLNWGTNSGGAAETSLVENKMDATTRFPRLDDVPGHYLDRMVTNNNVQVMARMPGPEELFPGLSNVPLSWLRDCRAYHMTTCRDMAEQAKAWKTFLRVRTETIDQVIQPIQIVMEKNELLLEGFHQGKAVRLTLGKMSRIQILLPEMGGL